MQSRIIVNSSFGFAKACVEFITMREFGAKAGSNFPIGDVMRWWQ
jgi:hypothetical protein